MMPDGTYRPRVTITKIVGQVKTERTQQLDDHPFNTFDGAAQFGMEYVLRWDRELAARSTASTALANNPAPPLKDKIRASKAILHLAMKRGSADHPATPTTRPASPQYALPLSGLEAAHARTGG